MCVHVRNALNGLFLEAHADVYAALKAGDEHALDSITLPHAWSVVTVCGAGKMSLVAAEQLAARGFIAYSLAGTRVIQVSTHWKRLFVILDWQRKSGCCY